MATVGGPNIVRDGLVFAWDGMSPRSWDGSSSTHTDLISKGTGTKTGANSIIRVGNHVDFNGGGHRNCYISFPSANITVPTGDTGTWMWAHYFEDAGNIDHPTFGKETTGAWAGDDGFVFGTGYGTDGPRWGIAGTAHTVYATTGASTGDYRGNVWQIYCVTYERNSSTGLKTYLHDSNGQRKVDERTTSNVAIGSNNNALHIGATNSRGGNWNGLLDFVLMYNVTLSQEEVFQNFDAVKNKFGL
ncbi:LamG domain-containing protein [bacterium]|nr:LamG domain-containing protein [bacterium]